MTSISYWRGGRHGGEGQDLPSPLGALVSFDGCLMLRADVSHARLAEKSVDGTSAPTDPWHPVQ